MNYIPHTTQKNTPVRLTRKQARGKTYLTNRHMKAKIKKAVRLLRLETQFPSIS